MTAVLETTDFHVRQFDGDGGYCDSKNCAAASGARAVYAETGEKMSADQFRFESGVSCVPGADTPSGGLRIGDVERVCARHGVSIDYGWDDASGYERWTPATLADRCSPARDQGAVLLIDYGYLRTPWRAPGSTFTGDHSTYIHDFHVASETYCWHDPLRKTGIRIPASEVTHCWWQPSSPLRGYGGFVQESPAAPAPEPGGGADQMIRYVPKFTPTSVLPLAKGARLYDSPGGDQVTRMSRDGQPAHLGLTRSPGGKAYRAVVVATAIPYEDGDPHRTVLYVTAANRTPRPA